MRQLLFSNSRYLIYLSFYSMQPTFHVEILAIVSGENSLKLKYFACKRILAFPLKDRRTIFVRAREKIFIAAALPLTHTPSHARVPVLNSLKSASLSPPTSFISLSLPSSYLLTFIKFSYIHKPGLGRRRGRGFAQFFTSAGHNFLKAVLFRNIFFYT